MIQYFKGTDVAFADIYTGFKEGFSDYMIKLEMNEEQFKNRFFGPEGNKLSHTFVAKKGHRTVGLVLGGIRIWDGLKTMRCGALCIHPEFRGTGISQDLLEFHIEDAKESGCERLSLEVIKGNERAVRFYERNAYFVSYDLKYYGIPSEKLVATHSVELEAIAFEELATMRRTLCELHLHWQGELDYYKNSVSEQHRRIKINHEAVGYISMNESGKVNFLWIDPQKRMQGFGKSALAVMADEMNCTQINLAFSNNGLIEGFARHLGFEKSPIEQFEMFRGLK